MKGNWPDQLEQLQGKLENSVLYIHTITFHRNENAKFKMEITGQFKDALTRQANEAVRIGSHSCSEIANFSLEAKPTGRNLDLSVTW